MEAESSKGRLCQLPIQGLSAPNFCMLCEGEFGPLDFSLPAAIETLSEGAGDMVQEERALPSSSSVLT